MNSLIPAMPFYPALPSYLGLQNSGNFPRIPWFSRNPAYSILIPGIFQMGFLENDQNFVTQILSIHHWRLDTSVRLKLRAKAH